MTDNLQPWQKELFDFLTKYDTIALPRRARSDRLVTPAQFKELREAFEPKGIKGVIIDEIREMK